MIVWGRRGHVLGGSLRLRPLRPNCQSCGRGIGEQEGRTVHDLIWSHSARHLGMLGSVTAWRLQYHVFYTSVGRIGKGCGHIVWRLTTDIFVNVAVNDANTSRCTSRRPDRDDDEFHAYELCLENENLILHDTVERSPKAFQWTLERRYEASPAYREDG